MQKLIEHMNLCSIHSPHRPVRSGEGNQTRKKLSWKMPLPDSSPSLGEGKVFSSSSSPFYSRKGVAGRGMLHVKCASVAPEPYPRISASRLPVTAPRTEHPPGPLAAPAPHGVPLPGGGSRPVPGAAASPAATRCPCSPALRPPPPPGRDRGCPQGHGGQRCHLLEPERCSPNSARPGWEFLGVLLLCRVRMEPNPVWRGMREGRGVKV